jgi:tetratricopeptide (TPR) repeat protein
MRRKKMQVNVYKSYPEFRKLAPYGDREVPMGVLGFFSRNDQSLNFYHDYQDPGRSTWVALHECTHLLTFLIDQQYLPQIWLNEGVADYFGSSKVERDKKGKITITPGELQVDRILTVQQAIKDGASGTSGGTPAKGSGNRGKSSYGGRPDTKLEQMFFLSHDEFDGFQYAHSWSFVYFLNNFEKGKYQKAFDKFFKGLYTLEKGIPYESIAAGGMTGNGKQVKAEDIRAYLLKKLGLKDTEQMEKDWKKFISEIPISGPEARLKRGLQSVARMEFDPALEDLNAAIEGGTKDPRAWWARGQALAFQKKTEDGIKDLAKAVELDPLNANYRYVYSHLLAGMPIVQHRRHRGHQHRVRQRQAARQARGQDRGRPGQRARPRQRRVREVARALQLSHAGWLAAVALAACASCVGTRTLTNPTLALRTSGGEELGVSTEYGIVFLGHTAQAGRSRSRAGSATGLTSSRPSSSRRRGPVHGRDRDPPAAHPADLRDARARPAALADRPRPRRDLGRMGRGPERRARAGPDHEHPRPTARPRRPDRRRHLRRSEQGPQPAPLVGLYAGELRLSSPSGERSYLAFVGPTDLWRLVAHRKDLLQKKRWIYRDDVL